MSERLNRTREYLSFYEAVFGYSLYRTIQSWFAFPDDCELLLGHSEFPTCVLFIASLRFTYGVRVKNTIEINSLMKYCSNCGFVMVSLNPKRKLPEYIFVYLIEVRHYSLIVRYWGIRCTIKFELKMEVNSVHIWHCLLYEFLQDKSAAEAQSTICATYGDSVIDESHRWLRKFKW